MDRMGRCDASGVANGAGVWEYDGFLFEIQGAAFPDDEIAKIGDSLK
jgi:hypothetical protein